MKVEKSMASRLGTALGIIKIYLNTKSEIEFKIIRNKMQEFVDNEDRILEESRTNKLVCSSCSESSDKEDFTMDEDYDYDVCDTCYQENYGK